MAMPPPLPKNSCGQHLVSEIRPLGSDSSIGGNEIKVLPSTTPMNHARSFRATGKPVLRYRKTPFWLLGIYLITLILPWILLSVLAYRPLTSSTYHDQRGRVDLNEYLRFWSLLAFIQALRSISGILTIPITTTILGYAAVTFAQRRHDGQKLSMAQLFALSDKGWTDITILWRAHSGGRSSWLLWSGLLLVLIGSIQQPLQSALITFETVVALSCADLPWGRCVSQAITVGHDADPWAMELVEHNLIVQDVRNSLVTLDNVQSQPYLWVDNPHGYHENSQWRDPTQATWLFLYGSDDDGSKISEGSHYFVSALPNGTHTGVLREHALRLNSSVTCENVQRSEFPSECSGSRPLDVNLRQSNVEIRVCVPGEIGRHPWTLSRSRQNIDEELFIDLQSTEPDVPLFPFDNFTLHCKASTARGYFELGNVMNDFVYGPLLDTWPDEKTIELETNDYTNDGSRPAEMDVNKDDWDSLPFGHVASDPFDIGRLSTSGTLMMAANALFGNTSFLQLAYTNATTMNARETLDTICKYGGIPFGQLTGVALLAENPESPCFYSNQLDSLDEDEAEVRIGRVLGSWIYHFREPHDADDLLDMSMFLVNRAVLQKTVVGTGPLYSRPIWASPGTSFVKPRKDVGVIIAISIFIFLQSMGLTAAVWYSRKAPTWTATLDSMAVAQISRAMKAEDIPPFGPVSDRDRQNLTKIDALMGIVDDDDDLMTGSEGLRLGLGGAGKIDARHAPMKKPGFWSRKKRPQPDGLA